MAIRECNYCHKEYHVYDTDAGTFLEHYCSEKCEGEVDSEIDEYIKHNSLMLMKNGILIRK